MDGLNAARPGRPEPIGIAVKEKLKQRLRKISARFSAVVIDDCPVNRFTVNIDDELIHFSCILQGSSEISWRNGRAPYAADALHLGYAPGETVDLRCTGGFRTVELLISPEDLRSVSEELSAPLLNDLRDDFLARTSRPSVPVATAARRFAARVEDASANALVVEATALEFLGTYLDHYAGRGDGGDVPRHHGRKLHAARDILLQDLSTPPPTIPRLARLVGLNPLQLKRGFRQVFGNSVYGLFQSARMAQARELLRGHSVTETAVMLGYSNISHFSAAFRRAYGVLPREVRKGILD